MKKTFHIRCPIHGTMPFTAAEMALINSRYLQRLRSITQLGFAGLVFPGATHTRFSHSLGACHLAGKVFDQLLQSTSEELEAHYSSDSLQYFKRLLRYAALLHDVGHPPFSHAAEQALPALAKVSLPDFLQAEANRQATHEDFTYATLWQLAKGEGLLSQEEAYDVISILSNKVKPSQRMLSQGGKPLIFSLLSQLINGEIDVDRMDYLQRDSLYAGVPYGKFDLERLIGSFSCSLEPSINRFLLTLDAEDIATYENFMLARMHMFYQIYFHKTLGAFTHYITQVFAQKEIDLAFDGTLENYLSINENGLKEEIRQAAKSKKWARRIQFRTPAKTLLRVKNGDPARLEKLRKAQEILLQQGLECFSVHSYNQYSSQLQGEAVNPHSVMVVEKELGKRRFAPLAERSSLLGTQPKRIEVHQLYIVSEQLDQALKILEEKL